VDNIDVFFITVIVVDSVGTDVKDLGSLLVLVENVVIIIVHSAGDERTAIVVLYGDSTTVDIGLLLEKDNIIFLVIVNVNVVLVLRVLVSLITVEFECVN
jgi:hypothetical protein